MANVSVIIPTTGRPELSRAIASVRAQVGVEAEVIVVVDGSNPPALDVEADQILFTGSRAGGGRARNIGVQASDADVVAFLDDDDAWRPTKLRDQLRLLREDGDPETLVVSGRHVHVNQRGGMSRAVPDVLVSRDQSVDDYLFRKRKPRVGRASLYTSTLLCSRSLATAVPWRDDLPRHQDWDWLLRLQREGGARFVQLDSVVAEIQTGSAGSVSASADWESSKQWADDTLTDRGVYVDFLAAQTLRYALNARSSNGVKAIGSAILEARKVPSFGPLVIGAAGLLPRRRLEMLMTRMRRASTQASGNLEHLSASRVEGAS